jgi:hypothetical protein
LVVALYAAIIAIYLAIIPPLQGFDSVAHFNTVNYLRQHRNWPAIDATTAAYSYELPQQPPLYYALAAGASAWLPFESADEITRSSDNPYQMTLSPLWTVDIPEAPASWRLAARISQWVSAMGGLLALIFTLAWVRLLLPGQWRLHTFTIAVVAMNPLFVYLSVTTSNDAWAVAGATALAWAGAWLARHRHARLLVVFGIGCVCGLAVLTKYSAGIGALAGLAAFLLLRHSNTKNTKEDEQYHPTPNSSPLGRGVRAARLLAFIAGVLLTAGAWYGANAIAYGELIPMRAAATALPSLNRPVPLTLAATLSEIPGLLQNYWGVFIGTIDANVYYGMMTLLAALGALGLLGMVRHNKRVDHDSWVSIVICAVWVIATWIATLWWVRSIGFGAHGRLLLVASPAVALLLALGWRELAMALPAQLRNIARAGLLGALLLLPLLPLPAFLRNYAQPAPINLAATKLDRVVNAHYDEGMIVAGIDLPQGPFISPQREMPLTLYLSSDAGVAGFYTLFVHLVDADGRVLHAFDGVPFGGRHPTRQWRAGETFADTYTIALPADFDAKQAPLLRLVAGFYPFGQPSERLFAHDGNGERIGDEVLLANVRVVDDAMRSAPITATLTQWDNGITLTEATFHEESDRVILTTMWQARSLIQRDYTLFVHLLDANGQLIAQQDQPPQGGHLPTSVWQAGELIHETFEVKVPADKAAQWTTAMIGLYDAATGERAKWASGDVAHADDTVVLRRR